MSFPVLSRLTSIWDIEKNSKYPAEELKLRRKKKFFQFFAVFFVRFRVLSLLLFLASNFPGTLISKPRLHALDPVLLVRV